MPQFDRASLMDVGGAISQVIGQQTAKRNAAASSVSGGGSDTDTPDNITNPEKLAYWMQKMNNRKNAAYTMWKRQKQAKRRGAM